MTIRTTPVFYYVESITSFNNLVNIIEPNGLNIPLTARVIPGSRSITDLLLEVQRGLNEPTNNQYEVTVDRETRIVTISADDDFDLLFDSGSDSFASPGEVLGFIGDQTGSNTYSGSIPIGSEYLPQFLPQSFDALEDNSESISPAVRESATGIIEVVSFGRRRFINMNIKYITDLEKSKGSRIRNNPRGLQDARDFLDFAITKVYMEFMKDKDNREEFNTVILESTRESRQGTAYKLKEMRNRGLLDFFETGTLKFREIR